MLCYVGFLVKIFLDGMSFFEDVSVDYEGCIFLDVWMLGMDGLVVQSVLNQCGIIMLIIILIGYGDVFVVVEVMKGGVIEFLEKLYEKQMLVVVIESVFEQFDM